MGVINKATCKACEKSWNYKLGCGINHCNLDVVLDVYDEETKSQVKMKTKDDKIPLFSFNYCRGVCNVCKAIVGVPVLKLLNSNTSYIGRCKGCGNEVDLLEGSDNLDDAVCPQCGEKNIEDISTGLWD